MEEINIVNILAVIGAFTIVYIIFKLIMSLSIINLYFIAKISEAPIPFLELVFMKVRKANVNSVVQSYVRLRKKKIDVNLSELEVAQLAGLDMNRITNGLIKAKEKNIDLTIKHIFEGQKRGIDVLAKIEI
jgi:uncharacterized protein YqfA (UPF0365 family)